MSKDRKNLILLILLAFPLKVLIHFYIWTDYYRPGFTNGRITRLGDPSKPESLRHHFESIFTSEVWIFIPVFFIILFIAWYLGLFDKAEIEKTQNTEKKGVIKPKNKIQKDLKIDKKRLVKLPMIFFNWLLEKKEAPNHKNSIDPKENSSYVINGLFDMIQSNISEKFDKNAIIKKYGLTGYDIDIDYWYDIILQRVKYDKIGAMYPYLDDAPFEEKLSKNIQGHFDTYEQKFRLKSVNDIYEIMRLRVLMFGHIYKYFMEEILKTNSESFYEWLKKSSVDVKDYKSKEELFLIHIKASLYSAIAFAMYHNISDNDILNWFPQFNDDKESIRKIPAECLNIIFEKNEKKKFDYDETYFDKQSKEIKYDDGWSEEYISNLMLKSEEPTVASEYKFMRNLCLKVEELISEDKSWTFKNNGQKRLYDLRYNISNSNEDQLTNQSSALQAIANTLGDLLNKFDNEGRDKNFEGYELIDQIYTRCALLYRDLDKDILSNIATPKTDKSSKIKERVRKTDYGHIEEKFEMVNGLKNGVAKEFDKKGKIKRTLYYIDGELMSFV